MEEINKLYLSKFIYAIGVLSTFTFTLYFLFHGLTFVQISTLFSVYFLATALFQIPTGGFADTYGHKTSFALGLIIESFYYLIFFLFPSFWGILFGMIIAALGVSFQAGANNSLVYEILNKISKSEDFVKINSRINSVGDFAVILTAPVGLLIYKYNHSLPYLISFVLVFISGIVMATVKFEFKNKDRTLNFYFNQIKTGMKLTFKNYRLLSLYLVWTVGLISSYVMTENISSPLQIRLGINVESIGFTQSLISIGYVVVGLIGYKLIQKIGGVKSLVSSIIFSFITLIILSQVRNFYGAGLIILFMISHSFRGQALSGLEQKELTTAQRTTMASTGNMLMTVCAALIMPFWGLLTDKTGLETTVVILSLFVLIIGLLGTLIYSRLNQKTTRLE